jgi:hypothetical protein
MARHDEQLKTADNGIIGLSKLMVIIGVAGAESVRPVVRNGKNRDFGDLMGVGVNFRTQSCNNKG